MPRTGLAYFDVAQLVQVAADDDGVGAVAIRSIILFAGCGFGPIGCPKRRIGHNRVATLSENRLWLGLAVFSCRDHAELLTG